MNGRHFDFGDFLAREPQKLNDFTDYSDQNLPLPALAQIRLALHFLAASTASSRGESVGFE